MGRELGIRDWKLSLKISFPCPTAQEIGSGWGSTYPVLPCLNREVKHGLHGPVFFPYGSLRVVLFLWVCLFFMYYLSVSLSVLRKNRFLVSIDEQTYSILMFYWFLKKAVYQKFEYIFCCKYSLNEEANHDILTKKTSLASSDSCGNLKDWTVP